MDNGSDNIYEVIVIATDAAGFTDNQIVSIAVSNVNEAPVFITVNSDLDRLENFSGVLVEPESHETNTAINKVTDALVPGAPFNSASPDDATRFNGRLEIRVRDEDNEKAGNDLLPSIPGAPGQTLLFSLSGGADAALFDINTITNIAISNVGVGTNFPASGNQFGLLTFKLHFRPKPYCCVKTDLVKSLALRDDLSYI